MQCRRWCAGAAREQTAEPTRIDTGAGTRALDEGRSSDVRGRPGTYVDGKWLEITYGRPSLRGRDVFGSGANYGKALIDLPLGDFGPPPVWRAGANVSTRLKPR